MYKYFSGIVFLFFLINFIDCYKLNVAYNFNQDFMPDQFIYEDNYYENEWNSWKQQFQRTYKSDLEELYRKHIFKTNFDYIVKHNLSPEKTFELGMNHFGDLTREEWSSNNFGYRHEKRNRTRVFITQNTTNFSYTESSLPESVDWRNKGAVTPVKNQGQCGSCWSFSATGAMEGAYFIAKNKLVSLSEQQLVDCSSAEGDHGCSGGLMDDAFEYVINNKGIDTENDYQYTAVDGTCNQQKQKKYAATFSSFNDVENNNEQSLAIAVFNQPVSVAIEADQTEFQFYKSGIFNSSCGTNLDHGVLVVGYGVKNNMKYWIVKNSWGEAWGNNGYIFMAKDIEQPEGQCGIAMNPSYPVV